MQTHYLSNIIDWPQVFRSLWMDCRRSRNPAVRFWPELFVSTRGTFGKN